ncbi:MAG: AmpG family muropeptide MFS transporter [Alphaproteobacteria bacterium]|nr:AmpG family muropeptide MFS transporter [Alphaproteobacteria bacterium]NCQ66796.1 AmpG family muropeptide MFS transporter [Alphaproteobacteria bacterium]NCT07364.1 AmpG family muropeptide MFS transporter [Alphaproteobacteria bacterium]
MTVTQRTAQAQRTTQESSELSKGIFAPYNDRRMLIMAFIGFSCGIPLFLTASTLSLWLNQVGISYTKIGLISWVAFPYTVKFLWSPFVDRLKIPFLTKILGRRRSWLLLSQIALILSIFALSQTDPSQNLTLTALFAICVTFSAATQDVTMLAYQVERLGREQYGAGEAMGIFGYRMGMLMAGAGALYFSEIMTWNQVYQVMALFILVGVVTTLFIKEPEPAHNQEAKKKEDAARKYLHEHPKLSSQTAAIASWLYGAVICPFSNFMISKGWWVSILIMLFYKFGDNLIGNMTNIFLVEVGYSKSEIAAVSKIFGMATSILGGFIGGYLIARIGIIKALFIAAAIHGLSVLLFVLIANVGYDLDLLYLTIAVEHITSGMRTTALFAFQMTLVTPAYAATQLALLTSAVHFGRVATSSLSGLLVVKLGWSSFFTLASAATIISLILVVLFAKIKGRNHEKTSFFNR